MLIPLLCTLLQAPAPPAASPQPFTLTLEGFVGKLEMIPLPVKSRSGKTLWVSKTEVTWEFYDVFAYRMDLTEEQKAQGVDAKARPSRPYGAPDRGYGHNGFAALSIQYDGAVRFCEWLSKKTGKNLRMPTESEWEMACRAGAKKPFSAREIDAMAWHEGNSDDAAQPVASKKPNAWGLFDMLGNAWEWCSPDKPGGQPAVRGGSFRDEAKLLNPTYRSLYQAEWQTADAQSPKSKWWLSDGPHIGFRIVCEE